MLVSVSTMPAKDEYFEYAKQIEHVADFLHLDVCDGEYNKTKCFSVEYAKKLNMNTTLPLDCHLMTKNPLEHAKEYIKAGVNIVTAQIEAFENQKQIEEFINYVKSNNTLVGLSIEPETSLKELMPFVDKLDVILIMAVKTGKSGQEFNMSVLKKITHFSNLKKEKKYTYKLEIDGGINLDFAKLVSSFGADIIVSGNYIFLAQDRQKGIENLKLA